MAMDKATIPEISGLVADVWVQETHRREMDVTENPIEYGSPTTDHAFVKARTLTVLFGVTNTPLSGSDSFSGKNRVEDARQQLFAIQDEVRFLTVITISGGIYQNCLLAGIGWLTDKSNPNSVIFELELQEVKVTSTQTVEVKTKPAETKTMQKTKENKDRGSLSKQDLSTSTDNKKPAATLSKAEAAAAQAEKIKNADLKAQLREAMESL